MKVLHIAGLPRTGSTILANVLGQVDGVFTAGELMGLRQALLESNLCGCGTPVGECAVWSSIVEDAFGGHREAIEVLRGENSWLRVRQLPTMLLKEHRRDEELVEYRRALGSLFEAIGRVTGARVIVEGSKRPTFGRILGGTPGVELYTVHLLRDPRATWDSWVRAKQWEHVGPLGMGATWGVWHSVVAFDAGRHGGRYLPLRYEDFVRRPRETTGSILSFLGDEGGAMLPFVDDHTVELEPTHSVHGNPSRFRTGRVPLAADDGWRNRLSRRDVLLTMAASWPPRRRWGYRLGGVSGRRSG